MKQWYKNRKKDHFYQLAKKNDVISRAYYKLEEIDKKYQIIKGLRCFLNPNDDDKKKRFHEQKVKLLE